MHIDTTHEGQANIDKSGYCLCRSRMLGSLEEVALTGLVTGIPFEDVELRVVAGGVGGLWRIGSFKVGGAIGES